VNAADPRARRAADDAALLARARRLYAATRRLGLARAEARAGVLELA
jgi:flagellin-like hook-associated protein FlgL